MVGPNPTVTKFFLLEPVDYNILFNTSNKNQYTNHSAVFMRHTGNKLFISKTSHEVAIEKQKV